MAKTQSDKDREERSGQLDLEARKTTKDARETVMDKHKRPKQFDLLRWVEFCDKETPEPSSEVTTKVDSDNEIIEVVPEEVDNGATNEVIEVVIEEVTPPKPAPYGYCACGEAITIPGLESSLCPRCGWRRIPD